MGHRRHADLWRVERDRQPGGHGLASRRDNHGAADGEQGRSSQEAAHPPGRVTSHAQHERVLADHVAGGRRKIESEPGEEARRQADSRAAHEPDCDHGEENQVRRATPRQGQPVDDRELREQRRKYGRGRRARAG
jgi:hypothetical protein